LLRSGFANKSRSNGKRRCFRTRNEWRQSV
jgi:hypothetical protein